jgi:hypothetical protein
MTLYDMMQEHNRQMEELTKKYISEANLAYGRSVANLWFKKQWYANRIRDLGVIEGLNAMRMRRCKRTDSSTYKKYEKIEQELRQVGEHLILELLCV